MRFRSVLSFLLLFLLSSCGLLKKLAELPILLRLEPSEGVAGTRVKVVGRNLGTPDSSPPPKLFFGEQSLCFDPGNPTCSVLSWNVTEIVFVVPSSVEPGRIPVYVETSAGKSNRLYFQLPSGFPHTGHFVTGILGEDRLHLFAFQVTEGAGGLSLQFHEWHPGESTGSFATGEVTGEGVVTTYTDFHLTPTGSTFLLFSQIPGTSSVTDGVHGFRWFSNGFTEGGSIVKTPAFSRSLFSVRDPLLRREWLVVYTPQGHLLTFYPEMTPTSPEMQSSLFPLRETPLDVRGFVFYPFSDAVTLFLPAWDPSLSAGKVFLFPLTSPLEGWVRGEKEILSLDEKDPLNLVFSSPPSQESALYLHLLSRKSSGDGTYELARYTGPLTSPVFSGGLTFSSGKIIKILLTPPEPVTGYLWVLWDRDPPENDLLIQIDLSSFPRGGTDYLSWKNGFPSGVTPFAEFRVTDPVDMVAVIPPDKKELRWILVLERDGEVRVVQEGFPSSPGGVKVLTTIPSLQNPKKMKWVPVLPRVQ